MTKKMIVILVVAVMGGGVGAMLGYGPLLRYKTEGVLSMEMGTTEYKRFSELANDESTLRQFADLIPPGGLDSKGLAQLTAVVAQGQWHKPVPRVSRTDAKELPDMLLQMEQDREKTPVMEPDRERTMVEMRKLTVPAYLGLRLTHTAADPVEASKVAVWLGGYVKDVAAREAVREQVARWKAENWQFADRARERKLKHEFTIEQAQTRAAAFKKIVANYPESARREGSQVVDVRKDNEKFISPQAQLVGAESEIIETRQKVRKLDRELEQQAFTQVLLGEVEAALKQARSGSESVLKLSAVIAEFGKKVKTEAERERLLSLAADLSQISGRFLTQAQFIAKPSVPTYPERPIPLFVIALGALLSAFLAAAFVWRKLIIKMLWQDDANKV